MKKQDFYQKLKKKIIEFFANTFDSPKNYVFFLAIMTIILIPTFYIIYIRTESVIVDSVGMFFAIMVVCGYFNFIVKAAYYKSVSYVFLIYLLPFNFFYNFMVNVSNIAYQVAVIIMFILLSAFVSGMIQMLFVLVTGFLFAWLASGVDLAGLVSEQTLHEMSPVYLLSAFVTLYFFYTSRQRLKTEIKSKHDLAKARDAAEKISNSQATFITNMNHDLRTPVTGILGIAQALKSKIIFNQREPDLKKKVLEDIEYDAQILIQATVELSNIFDRIFDAMTLQDQENKNLEQCFNIINNTKAKLALLRPAIINKSLQIDFQCDVDASLSNVVGYVECYDRLLINLISNAVKFTHEGSICVSLRCTTDAATAPKGSVIWFEVSISDTGIGISHENLDKIFENFTRLDSSYESNYKGLGIGLYLVKSYINSMNGSIKVKSEPGKGSEFIVKLPFKLAEDSIEAVQSNESLSHFYHHITSQQVNNAIIQKKYEGIKVLVVEDNDIAAIALSLMLKKSGCEVDVEQLGKLALEAVQNDPYYDLIILDIGLPDITGIQVAQQLKQQSATKDIPLVALTGHITNQEYKQKALDAGFEDVLLKPVDYNCIDSFITKYVIS